MWEDKDVYCSKIFWFLFLSDKKCRFTELHKGLKNIKLKLSKPTLIAHLGHLQEKGFIVRRQEDKQNVSYEVNWKKFEYLKESVGYKQHLLISNENKKRFKSLSPRDQLATLLNILILGELQRVRSNIDDFLEPEKEPEHHLGYWFMFKSLDLYQSWFIETFKQADKKTQKMLIEKVDGSVKILRDDIFTSEKVQT